MLYRSRTSSLIVLLGPIFIILLVGIAFSSKDLHGINIGIYSEENERIKNSILDEVKKTKGFTLIDEKSLEDCINDVKNAQAHICLEFSAINKTDKFTPAQLTFHVDYSKINLVFVILNTMRKQIRDQSAELTLDYTKQLLDKINTASGQMEEKSNLILELGEEGKKMSIQVNKIQADIDSIKFDTGEEIDVDKFKTFADNSKTRIDTINTAINSGIDENKKAMTDMKTAISAMLTQVDAQQKQQETLLAQYRSEERRVGKEC